MEINNKFLEQFLPSLSTFMGSKCEIVVHDFTNGFEHTVVQIHNSLTGRSIGAGPTNLFFETLQKCGPALEDEPVYYTDFPDGRTFKSCTTYLRDEQGNAIGAVCLNMDITDLLQASQALNSCIGPRSTPSNGEVYSHTLDELMEHYLNQVVQIVGKPAEEMDKSEKLEALDYLDRKGVLHMAKASVRLCDFFHFSKFTLYNYLEDVRSRREDPGYKPPLEEF